jgi:hypothetical protein
MFTLPEPFRHRRGAILLVALAALWLAQALAIAHASRHAAADPPAVPADHARLCTDCASMLQILTVVGGAGAALALLGPAQHALLATLEIRAVATAPHRAFRSRAPPR